MREYSEFIGIINYSIIALIQIDEGVATSPEMKKKKALIFTIKICHSKI